MNPAQDAGEPQFTLFKTKRLEKRFASLAIRKAGGSRIVTKEAFCSQPEVSTNVFVGAYIDEVLAPGMSRTTTWSKITSSNDSREGQHADVGDKTPEGSWGALTFEQFVHVFWVFSAEAPRAEKEQVVEMLLQPDAYGWVERRSMFRFVKLILPSAPDQALEAVVDDIMKGLQTDSSTAKEGSSKYSSGGSSVSRALIGDFLKQGGFIDKLTVHM